MTKRIYKPIVSVFAACALASALASCGLFHTGTPAPSASRTATPEPTPIPTPAPIADIRGLFPGSEPNGMARVLAVLNTRLEKEAFVRLALEWLPEDEYEAGIATALVSMPSPDFFRCAPESLPGYASSGAIKPLDELIRDFGENLAKNIDSLQFDSVRVGGRLMAVPAGGEQSAGAAFIYREDLRLKHGLPAPDTLANIEQYLSAVKEKEPDTIPLCSPGAALVLMPAFGPEAMLEGARRTVAVRVNADGSAACLPAQEAESLKGAAAKAREWFRAGWLPKDSIAIENPEEMVMSGQAASAFGAAGSMPTLQRTLSYIRPGAVLSCARVPHSGKQYIEGRGGALCLTTASPHPEGVVKLWDWVFAAQDNYDLLAYGVAGTDYRLSGDRVEPLIGGYGGFPAESFSNAGFSRYPLGTPDGYVEAVRHWNDGAEKYPLAGFAFDGSAIQASLDKAGAAFALYGRQLFTGSSDTEALLADLSAKLKAAGQDGIVAEAQAQVNAYLACG